MENLIFVFLLLGVIACSKSDQAMVVQVDPDQVFSSIDLGNKISGNSSFLTNVDFENVEFDHYLLMRRRKRFSETEDQFVKSLYAASKTAEDIQLDVAGLNLANQPPGNFFSYMFSNGSIIFVYNDVETIELPTNNFEEVEFSFTVDEKTYQGVYPDVPTLEGDNSIDYILNISTINGHTLYWEPSTIATDSIRIFISHTSTETSQGLQEPRGIVVPDSGEFFLTPELLEGYVPEDRITITLLRDRFVLADGLLIRCAESQYYLNVNVID